MSGSSTRRVVTWLSVVVLVAAPLVLRAQKRPTSAELIQPFLGDDYSQWMIGAIGLIASEDEIGAFQRLRDDSAAESFIREFWEKRKKAGEEGNAFRDLYERRAADADDEFTEGHLPGRRTDRGAIFIVYGPAEEIEHEEFRDVSEPDVELWRYPKKAEKGLDGRKPSRMFRFARQGDAVRFYKPPTEEELRRRARNRPPF